MKNAENLQVLIMALPHKIDRYWYMLGMLDAMEFDLGKCHTVMGRYWKDYKTHDDMIDAMVEDGFPWAERLRNSNLPDFERGFRASLWSACRCLRYIASQDFPCLMTEDDVKFTVTGDKLYEMVQDLPDYAEIAILDPKKPEEGEPYDENWIKGTYPKRSGAFINIYTPEGAKNALDIISSHPGHTLENFSHLYDEDTTFCTSINDPHLFLVHTPIQSNTNHGDGYSASSGGDKFKGVGEGCFSDRWNGGLDVGKYVHLKSGFKNVVQIGICDLSDYLFLADQSSPNIRSDHNFGVPILPDDFDISGQWFYHGLDVFIGHYPGKKSGPTWEMCNYKVTDLQVESIERFGKINNILNIDLLVLDIEGWEHRVLSSYRGYPKVSYLIVEHHSPKSFTHMVRRRSPSDQYDTEYKKQIAALKVTDEGSFISMVESKGFIFENRFNTNGNQTVELWFRGV